LNPQQDPHSPLQLNVVIPPPTKESREQAIKSAKIATNKAATAVRNARSALNKKLKAMRVKKLIRPDDLHKAIEQMEKIVERGQRDVKDAFEGARKTLQQG
jgi:ribosome recycling factor